MHIHIENGPAPLTLSAEVLRQRLKAEGLERLTVSENHDPEMFEQAVAPADILFLCRKVDLTAARRAAATLRWVQVISAGVEAYLPTLPEGVELTNASGIHGGKGGEFILAAAMMLNFQIPKFIADKGERRWAPVYGGPIAGKRVTLMGVGGVGSVAARLLRQHGAQVTGVTRSGTTPVELDRCLPVGRLDEVLAETEILISTLPLTPETDGLVDARRLAALPIGAGIVNVGRAGVFDYDALAAGLKSGALGGAVLDVFPKEPLPKEDPLWNCPNLIMTPHCSVDDHTGYIDGCLDIFIKNLRRWRDGQPLHNRVDPDRGY